MVIGLTAGACGGGERDSLQFGIRRLALDLAFVDEDAAAPLTAEVIRRIIPFDGENFPDDEFAAPPRRSDREVDLAIPALCPEADADATVPTPASPSIIDPPSPGVYPRRNTGSVEITGAGLPITLPYPPFSAWTISKAELRTRPGALGSSGVTPPARQYTVTKSLGEGFSTVERFELAAEALLLLERVTTTNGVVTTFRPDPPLEFFRFGAEGDDYVSSGVDTTNGYAGVIQGVITDRAVIDVCGELTDTFVIRFTEIVVNLRTGELSGTNEAAPTTLFFAPQHGGLVIREDVHTIQRTTGPGGEPLVARFDYVSTMLGTKPAKS
ncbi:MAG: hypothetical protein H0U92_06480 [Actinobacteria bacterium]|nr:hypothetical protein [Actinomycetota bacterium]